MQRFLLATLLCTVPCAAQELNILEGYRPFRSPSEDVEVPREGFNALQAMLNAIEVPQGHRVYFDENGREVSDHPAWQSAYESLRDDLHLYASRFGVVLRDSRLVNDRKIAAYGSLLLDDPVHVFELIAFFPGEPVREIRQEAMRRAIHFLKVHHPKNVESSEGVAPRYQLNVGPYLAMLELEDDRDRAQALWFLKEVLMIRPDGYETMLLYAKAHLPAFVVSENPAVRAEARALTALADPEKREAPAADAPDAEVLAWLDAILYDVFPPIRTVSEGRIDLYPSDDLDRIVEVGSAALARNAIGRTHHGVLENGRPYRGFAIASLPDPLGALRIPLDAVVTAVNGLPVASGPEIVAAIEAGLARGTFLVEFVHQDAAQAMEYRLRE